jgi:CheY-like chemotaxis protein
MSLPDFTKLIHEGTEILKAIVWPGIFLVFLLIFRRPLRELLDSAKGRKITLKIGGQELTLEEATEQQNKLIEDLQKNVGELKTTQVTVKSGTQTSAEARVTRETMPSRSESTDVLWVDDVPSNNSFFLDLLQRRGYRVSAVRSTKEALELIGDKPSKFRIILSDMGRAEPSGFNPRAGLDFFEKVHDLDREVPFIICTNPDGMARYGEEFRAKGGKYVTHSGTDLTTWFDQLAPKLEKG